MRGIEAGAVTFSESSGPSVRDAAAVVISQSAGVEGIEGAAVVVRTAPYPTCRVLYYAPGSTNSGTFMWNTFRDLDSSTMGTDITVEVFSNAGARDWFTSTGWNLWDYDLFVLGEADSSTEAQYWRAACDEAECSFVVGFAYENESNTNSTYAGGGPAEDFGLVSTGAGRYLGTNVLTNGYSYTFLSTHPAHAFTAGDYNLYDDFAIGVLSTDAVFVGTGFGWHTSTQGVPALGSTERHYCMAALPEGTTDASTGGVIRRRSMMWGGGRVFATDKSTGAIQLAAELTYWMLSTGPLIPWVATTWTDRSVYIESARFRHLNPNRTHSATRYQVDYSTGDFSSPLFESGWSTALYAYNATGFDPGVSYRVRVAHLDDADGESRWTYGLGDVSSPVVAEAGMRVEFISSTGGVLQTLEYWTNSAAYTERVVEAIDQPANTASVRLTPVKQGTADSGVCAKEVYVESGAIAAGYHPAPFLPARDDDTLITPSWLDLGVSTSTGVAVDFSVARHQALTLAHNVTFSFAGYEAGGRYLLLCEQDGTGSRTGAFGSVNWAGGTAPTLTTTTGAKDVIVLDAESTSILHGDYRLDSK